MRIGRAFSVQLAATGGLALLQVVSLAILSRMIAPVEFGYAASASLALLVGLAISDGGFGAALIRKRTLNQKFFNTVVSLALLISLPINLTVYTALTLFWNEPKVSRLVLIFSIAAETQILAGVFKSTIQREMRYFTLLKVNGIAYFFGMLVLAVVLASADYGAYSIAFGQLCYGLLSLLLAYYNTGFKYSPVVTRRYVRPILGFGAFVTFNRLIDVFLFEMEKLFLGKYAGFQEVGIYERVSRIGLLAGGHSAFIIDSVLYPRVCRDLQNDAGEDVEKHVVFLSALAGVIFVAISGFTEPLISLLLGSEYISQTFLLSIVLVSAYLRVLSRPFEVVARAEGRPQLSAFLKIPPTLALGISLLLLADMSMVTWAAASLAAQAGVLLLQFGAALKLRIYLRTLSIVVFVHAPITAGLMMFVSWWQHFSTWQHQYPPYVISVALAVMFGLFFAGRFRRAVCE